MAAKKSTDVMIAGKVYTLSGYEEEGYLQHVASYINTKISEITEREEYRRIPNDMKSILIQLNIADDFFKAKKQFETAEENYKKAEKDLFELKHELVDTQMKVEELLEKLNRERLERNQKSGRESQLEENYKKLEEKYQLLLSNAKVAEERNRQFEEMLRLTQQEKRETEAVNKELRLNKEKLEATLADALLGAASSVAKETAAQQTALAEEQEEALAPAELSKEEVIQLREAVHETMAELKEEEQQELPDAETVTDQLEEYELQPSLEGGQSAQAVSMIFPDSAQLETEPSETEPSEMEPSETELSEMETFEAEQTKTEVQDAGSTNVMQTDKLPADDPQTDDSKHENEQKQTDRFMNPANKQTDHTAESPILLTPGLSEAELTELLGPIRETQPAMPELSKEELEELLAPADRHELTDEGPMPELDEEDEFIPSVMSEITDDDDPEIKALARQIAELERQEQAEKFKKKTKKGKKRKH